MVVARNPAMLGINSRTSAAIKRSITRTRIGSREKNGALRTVASAIQTLAPLLASARASDSEEAITKKLDQPNPSRNPSR